MQIENGIQAISLPDGGEIAIGERDGTVRVIEAITLRPLWSEKVHEGPIRVLAWSPDGRHLATGGQDGVLRILDATDGRVLRGFEHEGPVDTLVWSSEGSQIASGDGTSVYRWSIPSEYQSSAELASR